MKLRLKIGTFVVALALCGTAGFSQNQNQNQNQNQDQNQNPIDPNAPLQPLDTNPMGGAYNKPPVGAARGVDAEGLGPFDPAQVVPDQNTLAGAAPYTLGSLQHTRNILDPAISLSQVGQVVPDANGTSVLVGQTLASASLNFNRIWGAYNFSALYNGGESFNIGYSAAPTFFGQSAPHYQFHTLILTQQANWARWHLLLRDNFMASPGAAFTGQGLGGPGLSAQFSSLLGNTLNSYSSEFEPAESVNTGSVLRFSNSILGQAEYSFTRRATITFAGSYGLLDFNTPGYFNSNLVNAQAGFDYLITPHDSLAILGGYGQITFNGTGISSTGTTPTTTVANGNAVVDYAGALAYGRRITGRVAFQVAVGAQDILTFVPGSSAVNFQQWFTTVSSALTYERRRTGFGLGYTRGLNAGSGVYLGATANTVTASAHYQFTRFWTGLMNGGYAINESLAPAGVATTQFDNWFVGANLGRALGTHAHINFNYGATRQNNPTICLVLSCGGTGLQQTVGVSFNWHLRRAG